MKIFYNFMRKYEETLLLSLTSKNKIDRRFYFKNGILVSVIGYGTFLLIGLVMNLLGTANFVFYGINTVLFGSLFVLVYSKYVYLKSGTEKKYEVRYLVITDLLYHFDFIVVLIALFVLITKGVFVDVELIIIYSFSIIYLVISNLFKKYTYTLEVVVPIILFYALLNLTLGMEVLLQYSVIVFVMVAFVLMKKHIGIGLVQSEGKFAIVLIAIFLFMSFVRLSEKYSEPSEEREIPGFKIEETSNDIWQYHILNMDDDYVYYYHRNNNKTLYGASHDFSNAFEIDNPDHVWLSAMIEYEGETMFYKTEEDVAILYELSDDYELVRTDIAIPTYEHDFSDDYEGGYQVVVSKSSYNSLILEVHKEGLLSRTTIYENRESYRGSETFLRYGSYNRLNMNIWDRDIITIVANDQNYMIISGYLFKITQFEIRNFKPVDGVHISTSFASLLFVLVWFIPYPPEKEEKLWDYL